MEIIIIITMWRDYGFMAMSLISLN